MSNDNQVNDAALMLSALGKDLADAAVGSLETNARDQIKARLEELEKNPPADGEVERVLREFERFFSEAVEAVNQSDFKPRVINDSSEEFVLEEEAEASFDIKLEPERRFVVPEPSGNCRLDLNRLHPYQVARALRNDTARTIAIVIQNLTTEHAAKTIENLAEEVRSEVAVELSKPLDVSPTVVDSILEAALAAAIRVDRREPEENQAQQMIELMRTLPKKIRTSMINHLMEVDEEFGAQVQSQLFQFEDMVRLEDRDIQKLLSGIDTDSLVIGLQQAPPELVEKLLGNMSKRARQSIEEEMEFKKMSKNRKLKLRDSKLCN